MKLVYVVNGICGVGGLEKILAIRTHGLIATHGHQVHIISMFEEEAAPFFEFHPQVNITFLGLKTSGLARFFGHIGPLKQSLRAISPDIISVCDDGIKGLAMSLFLKSKPGLIYERHAPKGLSNYKQQTKIGWLGKQQLRLMDLLASRYDRVVLLTKGNLEEWNINNGVVIPNSLAHNEVMVEHNKQKIVLAVGKQAPVKGYDRLLKIWKQLSDRFPDWKLQIVGTFAPQLGLESLRDELGLQDTVRFLPPDPNIGPYYNAAAVYAMTSHLEGFGMVLIEAMQYGLPCVAFDCPYGPKDIIDDGIDGYLVDDGDLDRFKARLSELMEDKDKRQKMGIAAIDKSAQYNRDRIGQKWNELYMSVLDER